MIFKKKAGFSFEKIRRKTARIFQHYPRRVFQVSAYGLRRLTGHAFPEPELTWQQKWQSGYILPGCRHVRSPRGYFRQTVRRLRVIDDFLPLAPFVWEHHPSTELPLPNTASNQSASVNPWQAPEASFVLKVSDGFVAPDGLVFDNKFIYRNGRWFYQPPPAGLPVERYDRLLTLVQLWGHRFIHFSFDTLPRIDIAFDFLKGNPAVRILVPDAELYRDIFQALEIDLRRLVPARPDRIYAANEVFCPHFYSAGRPHKLGLMPLNAFQRVRPFLNPESRVRRNQIVYLKRLPPANRLVDDEEELLRAVSRRLKPEYQLVVYAPVDDWRKDRVVMQNARVVFGPHGGAWSNIVFCPDGTDVVEFLPLIELRNAGKNERPCYYGLACGLGLRYWTVAPDNFHFDSPGAMRVPVQELLAVFQRIGIAD